MTDAPSPAAEMLELAAAIRLAFEQVQASELPLTSQKYHDLCRAQSRAMGTFDARSRTLGPLLAQQVLELTAALETMVYEATHLSPEQDDGSHRATISKAALTKARSALAGKPQTEQKP